ncbi:Ribosomal lysine N-methyltransferase 4 [Marasmius crinis-equi]|uniref:Ribosomal lysine N-methyltransferase 4 n=1 Tax=Marasmius crinis-equi TaxID=585013 RepID=A0ABR3FJZ0_9AGAR
MSSSDLSALLSWFTRNGASYDTSSIGFKDFEAKEGGRGAVALQDIPEEHVLFTIPRSLTLSTRTSSLPNVFGMEDWKRHKLDEGWAGLILCMMWERAQGSSSRWAEYLGTVYYGTLRTPTDPLCTDTLPTAFDTPMFWNADDLKELKGTSIVVTEKLGKQDAERDYNEKVLPAVTFRPEIFAAESIPLYYTLEQYHIMGSRILSRSFDVERWEGEEDLNEVANTSSGSAMDVDIPESEREGTPEEEEEDPVDVSMVPMADLLNARFGSENAKLFHEDRELRMVSTKPIKAGEQIWNTYGDLPNAELLRRYGHVDLLPLTEDEVGNPGDVVEIRADLIVSAIAPDGLSFESAKERIDWYLEEGGDDVLVVESDADLPQAMILLIRLLTLPDDEWKKAKQKGKLPKAKADAQALGIASRVLEDRLSQYPTNIKDDEALLTAESSLNKRHAIVVRLGEKRILSTALEKTQQLIAAEKTSNGGNKRKRPEGGHEDSSRKSRTKPRK